MARFYTWTAVLLSMDETHNQKKQNPFTTRLIRVFLMKKQKEK
jgi:hypothetical protein